MAIEGSSRSEILRRIQAANGGAADGHAVRSEWASLERNYKRNGGLEVAARLRLFEDRLRDYDANVGRSDRESLAAEVGRRLQERCARRIVIPVGFPAARLPAGFEFVVDEGLSGIELDAFDGVLTEATVAIAETGTLVLQNVAGQGRRAMSLVPDYHLCLLHIDDVVETVPEAMSLLHAKAALPTTFISGPSATADIEMTRIKGVHGPRMLDVIVFD